MSVLVFGIATQVVAIGERSCATSLPRLSVDQHASHAESQLIRQPQARRFSVDFPTTLGIDPDKVDAEGNQQQELTEEHFHRVADVTLGELLQSVNAYLEQHGDRGATVDMTEGKLQIKLGGGRALVVAKDLEARQLHTSGLNGDATYVLAKESSGVLQSSGADGTIWQAVGGGKALHEVIEDELKDATGTSIDLEPEHRGGFGPDPT